MYYFSATEPEFAALMALIYAHRAFFSLFFCICCVFPNRMICVKGSAVRLKIVVITKRKTGKMEVGEGGELRLYCDIALGVTEKYDFSLLNNNMYRQSALRSTL